MGNKSTREASPAEKALQQVLVKPSRLRAEMFGLSPAGHHGVPSNAKIMAFCGLQGILAVGTASGSIKLYGADGLEFLIDAPRSKSNLTIGITHMVFTARQRLVAAYSNSSIRIYNLANPSYPEVEVPETWTLSTITCIEAIAYANFPYIFVALDDGNIHIFHEDTGKTSTYVITPRDCGITAVEDEKHLQFVTSIAVNPRDANQLLIGYENSSTVYQWDLAKHKMVNQFSLAKTKTTQAIRGDEPNSVQSISWHSSGKRFVVGYKYGGFGVFRQDKPHGLYHTPLSKGDGLAPISRIYWISAPPTSRHSHLSGAIIFSGGREIEDTNTLTIIFPPRDVGDEDAITSLMKSEQLTWQSTTIQAKNHSEIAAFVVAKDQVDYSARLAPLSVILLSGNPLDGQQPAISVQSLPCFVRLREEDKEEWEWIPERLPKSAYLPPLLLQQSALKSMKVVSLSGCDGTLQQDLVGAVERSAIDPVFQLMVEQEFDWPINGGSVAEPLLKGFIPSSAEHSSLRHVSQSATLLATGHANGFVILWEIHAAADRASRGTLKLLHVVDVAGQLNPIPANAGISCVEFCPQSRSLYVGFCGGEITVLEFGQRSRVVTTPEKPAVDLCGDDVVEGTGVLSAGSVQQVTRTNDAEDDTVGFHVVFSLHIHSTEIKHICFSSAYNYLGVADEAGVVSLIDLTSRNYELLIFDISSDELVSVDSLRLCELAQVTDIPVPFASSSSSPGNKPGSRSPPSRPPVDRRSITSTNTEQMTVIQHREIVPVLFVGRGNSKLEMFHVQTAKKIGESLFDPQKASALTSIIMVDASGREVVIGGRLWSEHQMGTNDGNDERNAVAELGVTMKEKAIASPEAEQITEQALADAIGKATEGEVKTPVSESLDSSKQRQGEGVVKWEPTDIVETRVPAGSLGLHLFTEIQEHAIVKGFVLDNDKALALAAQGVSPGHAIISINGVDLLPYSRGIICSVLERLREMEKVMVFAKGFGPLPDTNNDPEVGTVQDALAEKPRFLLCTSGRAIHLIQAALPKASEIATTAKEELHAQPLATIEVSTEIRTTTIIRLPVHESVENCVVAIDQSNRIYVISLMTLTMIWSTDCAALGSSLDGIHCGVSANGELIVSNTFGEIERFSLLSDETRKENAIFELAPVKTQVILEERQYPFDKEAYPSPKKKTGIAALKKLVSGSKEVCDLNKVFQFSAEADERRKLMGDRKATSPPKPDEEKASVAKTSEGLGATKEALNQAAQHLQQRGEKLSDLAVKTEKMRDTAEDFYKTMKAFNDKNTNKKWYEF